ncbi:hypothetical protein EVAR_60559_1 [Eumeta japonica]|uniref:Uncharacterized protein n=1 Tax=Eumeta variegata TaxID=151549 RepID=A0A4C1YIE2_EUMVA|nr:hypothetical protein EVAR_60559_1 [Eumeta japonica]
MQRGAREGGLYTSGNTPVLPRPPPRRAAAAANAKEFTLANLRTGSTDSLNQINRRGALHRAPIPDRADVGRVRRDSNNVFIGRAVRARIDHGPGAIARASAPVSVTLRLPFFFTSACEFECRGGIRLAARFLSRIRCACARRSTTSAAAAALSEAHKHASPHITTASERRCKSRDGCVTYWPRRAAPLAEEASAQERYERHPATIDTTAQAGARLHGTGRSRRPIFTNLIMKRDMAKLSSAYRHFAVLSPSAKCDKHFEDQQCNPETAGNSSYPKKKSPTCTSILQQHVYEVQQDEIQQAPSLCFSTELALCSIGAVLSLECLHGVSNLRVAGKRGASVFRAGPQPPAGLISPDCHRPTNTHDSLMSRTEYYGRLRAKLSRSFCGKLRLRWTSYSYAAGDARGHDRVCRCARAGSTQLGKIFARQRLSKCLNNRAHSMQIRVCAVRPSPVTSFVSFYTLKLPAEKFQA